MGAKVSTDGGHDGGLPPSHWFEMPAIVLAEAIASLGPDFGEYREELIKEDVDGDYIQTVDLEEEEWVATCTGNADD